MRVSHPFLVALGVATLLAATAALPLTAEGRDIAGALPGARQLALASSYVVQAGDTLYGIASRNGISAKDVPDWIDEVVKLNGLADPNKLSVGEKIQLPDSAIRSDSSTVPPSPGATTATVGYAVQPGDTLSGIASKLGIGSDGLEGWIANVVRLNGLASADTLTVGQQIKLPSAASGVAPIPATPSPSPTPVLSTVTKQYTVQPGDTLQGIAVQMQVLEAGLKDWMASVVKTNGLDGPDLLIAGQVLQLPVAAGDRAAAPAQPATPASSASVAYTIQPGDTLFSIGEKLGISGDRLSGWVTQVLTLSGIASTDLLHEGQVIQIPVSEDNASLVKPSAGSGGSSAAPASSGTMDYTVQTGDTLSSIGDKIGVAAESMAGWISQVLDLNGMSNANFLTLGQHLILPRPAQAVVGPGGGQTAGGPDTATSESSCFYTVRGGDTWASIAAKLGIAERNFQSWVALVSSMNGIDPTLLPVGDALRLPC